MMGRMAFILLIGRVCSDYIYKRIFAITQQPISYGGIAVISAAQHTVNPVNVCDILR